MSDKYAQEMILIPKPDQVGGHPTPDTIDQFWQRRLTVDRLVNAPHVDRMRKILSDMKQVEGQATPSSVPGEGPDSSDYFRLQRQLQRLEPNRLKAVLASKKSALPSSKRRSTRPPMPTSVKEVLEQRDQMEHALKQFQQRAQQEMEQALREGDEQTIKEARRKWNIVNYNVEEIRKEDDFLNSPSVPSWWEELYAGKEETQKARAQDREESARHRDKLYRQLEDFYPNQRGQGYVVWQKPRGWIQE